MKEPDDKGANRPLDELVELTKVVAWLLALLMFCLAVLLMLHLVLWMGPIQEFRHALKEQSPVENDACSGALPQVRPEARNTAERR